MNDHCPCLAGELTECYQWDDDDNRNCICYDDYFAETTGVGLPG